MDSKVREILNKLQKQSRPNALPHLAKYGINIDAAYGVSIPDLRKLAKESGKSHSLAIALWKTGIHDARILASMVDERELVTEKQMNEWVRDFNSWDLCDQCCNNLFVFTVHSEKKALEWSKNKKEFIKRAGFVLMAVQAVHHRDKTNDKFINYFDIIKREAYDERNFVKKAVNWALRQIGKRNWELNTMALEVCDELRKKDSKAARWIALDAIKDLKSETAERRIKASLKKHG